MLSHLNDNILKNTIFIIETDQVVLESLVSFFRLVGFKTQGFSSMKDYLEVLDDTPGCLIFDISTPDMKGMEQLSALRKIIHLRDVLVISDVAFINTAVQVIKLGASDFIEKPFTTEFLLDRVVNMISVSDLPKLKEYLYVMEVNVEYENPFVLLDKEFTKRDTLTINLEYVAANSCDAIKLLRKDMADEMSRGFDLINFDIMCFVEKAL